MKRNFVFNLGMAVTLIAGVAIAQETSPARKPKPAAGRVMSEDAPPAATTMHPTTTTTATPEAALPTSSMPAGASVQGRITQLSEPRRLRGVPVIDLKPESVTMPTGEIYNMSAVVVDTADPKHHDVDEEGRIKGRGHTAADIRNVAVGVGI